MRKRGHLKIIKAIEYSFVTLKNYELKLTIIIIIIIIIIHWTRYLFSDWPKAYMWIFEISTCDVIPADYTIIMSRTLKVMGNHDRHDCGAWFPRVIMSNLRALCGFRRWRSKTMSRFASECLLSRHFFFCSMYNKTNIRFTFVISRIIKV